MCRPRDKITVHSESRAAVLRLTAIIRKRAARAEPQRRRADVVVY